MVRPVVELDTDVVYRIAGEYTARERFLDPFVDGIDELLCYRTTDRIVLEDVARSRFARTEMNLRVGVLPSAARRR